MKIFLSEHGAVSNPTGPFSLSVEQRIMPVLPVAFAVGGYGSFSGNSKHTGMGKVGSRWYRTAGDINAGGDPLAATDAGTFSPGQGGRQEIWSFDPTSDYSWAIETHYFMRASESAVQGWNYDDAFAQSDGTKIYSWRAAGVQSGIIAPTGPNGPYATLINRPMPFTPGTSIGTGMWSDPGAFSANAEWNSAWGAFLYSGMFLIPCGSSAINIRRISDWVDLSCRSAGGAIRDIVYPGDGTGAYSITKSPGFIRGAKIYLLYSRSGTDLNSLVEIDLALLLSWSTGTVGAAQPGGLITVIGTVPERVGNLSVMNLDTVNDVIYFANKFNYVRSFTGDVTVWQQFPLYYDGHASYDDSGTVTVSSAPGVNGSWSTTNATVGSEKPGPVTSRVTITGTFVGTVTLQHDTGSNGIFIDVSTWTAPVSKSSFSTGSYLDTWRVGVKNGDWVSGSVTAKIDTVSTFENTRRFWDPDYPGLISISKSGGGSLDSAVSRDENSYYILKVGSLPSWIPSPGQLKVISIPSGTGSTIGSINSCPLGGCSNPGPGNIGAFSGGVYNPWWGTLGGLVAHGGGDADYFGNEIMVFDIALQSWTLAVARTSVPFDYTNWAANVASGSFNSTWGEFSDGSPQSIHSYDQLAIIPPSSGGGTQGSLVRTNHQGWSGHANYYSWHRCDLTTGVWQRASNTSAQGANTYSGALEGPSQLWVPWLQSVWSLVGLANSYNYVVLLDYRYPNSTDGTGAGVLHRQSIGGSYTGNNLPVTALWPKWKMAVAFKNGLLQCFDLLRFDVDATVSDYNFRIPFRPTTSGDTFFDSGDACGFCYDQKRDCFWAYSGQPNQRQFIYRYDPPEFDLKTANWVCTKIALPSTAPDGVDIGANNNGLISFVGKRIQYVPTIDCIVWWCTTLGPVYAYRPV